MSEPVDIAKLHPFPWSERSGDPEGQVLMAANGKVILWLDRHDGTDLFNFIANAANAYAAMSRLVAAVEKKTDELLVSYTSRANLNTTSIELLDALGAVKEQQ